MEANLWFYSGNGTVGQVRTEVSFCLWEVQRYRWRTRKAGDITLVPQGAMLGWRFFTEWPRVIPCLQCQRSFCYHCRRWHDRYCDQIAYTAGLFSEFCDPEGVAVRDRPPSRDGILTRVLLIPDADDFARAYKAEDFQNPCEHPV